jgi:CRISPR-associated protein Cas5t
MKIYRVTIRSWTGSFRYPSLLTQFQPSLPVPPLSSIVGLIQAAMGYTRLPFPHEKIGYFFRFGHLQKDLETSYKVERGAYKNVTTDVIWREFLTDCELFLYTDSQEIAQAFRKPIWPILMGRSGDLASVDAVEMLELEVVNSLNYLRGTLIPHKPWQLPGPIQALPKSFTDTFPRKNAGTEVFTLLEHNYRQPKAIAAEGVRDTINGKMTDIFWQSWQ